MDVLRCVLCLRQLDCVICEVDRCITLCVMFKTGWKVDGCITLCVMFKTVGLCYL